MSPRPRPHCRQEGRIRFKYLTYEEKLAAHFKPAEEDPFHSGVYSKTQLDNAGTLNKLSAGTVTIASDAGGSYTNSGTIHVQAGTLDADTALSNSGTVKGAGTLSLPGLVSTDGEFAPGNSVGTLTLALTDDTGEIDFQAGTDFTFELAAPGTGDRIDFTGLSTTIDNVLFDGNTVNFSNAGGLAPGTYTLFTFDQDNAYSGTLTVGTGLEDYAGSSLVYNDDSIQLSVIPEPSTLLLLGLAFGLALVRRRFR